MLRSYLILAIKVLNRRKFYTFISLFGIAFTLASLMIVTTLFEDMINPKGAEKNSETLLTARIMALYKPNSTSGYRGNLGYAFIRDGVYKMTTPALISGFSNLSVSTGFNEGHKIESQLRRTDANYWRILYFDFIEGRPFSDSEAKQGDYVAVINRQTRALYFGDQSALGKTLVSGGVRYRVIGVVKNESSLNEMAAADIWVPVLATSKKAFLTAHTGGFSAMFRAESPADIARIKEEYATVVANYAFPQADRFPEAFSFAESRFDHFARNYYRHRRIEDSGAGKMLWQLGLAMLVFMLLPAVNLINLNVSRIMERSAEIGVRKSFGASSRTLMGQFLVENLILTVLGGLIGFVLAFAGLQFIVASGIIPYAEFSLNLPVFALGCLFILVFGLLSGLVPALKMSRMNPVNALKGVY